MSNIWIVMLAIGLLTYLTRLTFTVLLQHWQPPKIVESALRYVPVAVLTAIIVPELLVVGTSVDFSLGNARLIAGVVAILVAWFSKSAVLTIVIGMVVFLALNIWIL